MDERIALIGFGEAGGGFARAGGWQSRSRIFDTAGVKQCAAVEVGFKATATNSEAVSDAAIILSLVTADQALKVAQQTAQAIAPDALFLDMNSVAPGTKGEAAKLIQAAGGRYVDVAVMAPVDPKFLDVPLLISGSDAEAGARALAKLGFTNTRIVGDQVGRASTIKMLRSVMYKGVEALTAECLIACERAGVTDEVLASSGNDWSSGADYRLDRMLVHGLRRAAEMSESARTLADLGVSPLLTEGTIGWQQVLGDCQITPVPEGLKPKLAAIMERLS